MQQDPTRRPVQHHQLVSRLVPQANLKRDVFSRATDALGEPH